MNRLPNGTRVYILDKTVGSEFEGTEIYKRGQNFGYIRGWKDDLDCYIIRWDEGTEVRGDYFRPEDVAISLNKGRA